MAERKSFPKRAARKKFLRHNVFKNNISAA